MSCIDENVLVGFLRGELAEQETAGVEAHLDACGDCRELVSALGIAAGQSAFAPENGDPEQSTILAMIRTEAPYHPGAKSLALLGRGDQVGRYVILAPLGSGGMGVVYAAYDPELDRKVALKLLRADLGLPDARGTSWLLREAQAMARLQHPNVIAVHDVGEHEGQVFVAMEHLEGVTLGDWLGQRPRAWREILAAFLHAGAGLAAAHDAGLVHRDFKPGNVMVTGDGRVRVLDFGLARPVEGAAATDPDLPARPEASTRLSRSGAVVGTPLYMAPEQHSGAPADARTDQFSFCLALYEALYGERPFAGETEAQLRQAKEEGRVGDPPRGTRVPGAVRRAILRGLAPKREERFPDMDSLLRTLARDGRGWSRLVIALATGLALGLGAWGLVAAVRAPPPSLLCKGAERKLEGVWDDARRAAVRQAFLATRTPYAAVAWNQVRRVLGGYSSDWVRAHTAACEATRVRGEQSTQLLDLRMQCFGRLLTELRALTRLFARADAKVVERAVSAVHGLSPVSRCADARRLRSRGPAPNEAIRARSESLLARVAQARALEGSGKYREGLAVARTLAKAAGELGYRPLEAEARWLLGSLEELAGDAKRALRQLQRALWAAQAGGQDRLVALAATGLVQVYGYRLGKFDQARSWARFATAALERLGGDLLVEADLACRLGGAEYVAVRYKKSLTHLGKCLALRRRALGDSHPETAAAYNDVGLVLWNLGRYAESLAHHRKAHQLRRRLLGARHPEVSVSLNNLGLLFWTQGKFEKAEANFREAVAIREVALGPKHPDLATALGNLGLVLRAQGRYPEGLKVQRRALAIRKAAYGPDHVDVATSANNVAVILGAMGRFTEGLEMAQRAYAIRKNVLGARSAHTARTLTNVGKMLHGLGRYREALPRLREAVAVNEKLLGRDHPGLVRQLIPLAGTLIELKRFSEAVTLLTRARRIAHKRRGTRHPLVASALKLLGEAALAQRRWTDAIGFLDEALAIRADRRGPPARLAAARFALARALRGARREPARAQRLARQALAAYRTAGRAGFRRQIAAIEKWLQSPSAAPATSRD